MGEVFSGGLQKCRDLAFKDEPNYQEMVKSFVDLARDLNITLNWKNLVRSSSGSEPVSPKFSVTGKERSDSGNLGLLANACSRHSARNRRSRTKQRSTEKPRA